MILPTRDARVVSPAIVAESRRPYQYAQADRGEGVTIATRGDTIGVGVDPAEDRAVHRAVEDLCRDLVRVAGARPVVGPDLADARIVVGTIGTSEAIDSAIVAGELDISSLCDRDGALRWEGFLTTLVDDVLYLVGADRRGTIYAVYDFAEVIGVSPWYWWGDVPVRPREHITIDREVNVADWPSVRHRGVFLNDEEELYHWARTHTSDGTIGPAAYERIFELILRLKGNYLWAAMHVGAFNDDPENGRLADEMGVIIGTQHCDMLLRSNEHEFRPWVERRGEHVEYDYSLHGRNRDLLREYWRGSVAQNRSYEVTWSVGMRGVHDSGFVTTAIDNDPALTEAEKLTARVRLLERVIRDQRALLSEELGKPAADIPQLFIPYKEVLPLYDAGLQVPDDVTMVWANDSFGHIRRFPDAAERQRSGGHGLYYHSSYWSNYVTSYLATSSTPLALMKSELRKAWDGGIRRLWVDNIGGLKPLEMEMEFFLRSGWEAGKETTTADIPAFTAQWIDAKFSGGHGTMAGKIYADYYQLNNQRKIEHLASDVFPQAGYGDEAGRRLAALRALYDQTNAILTSLPADERDSFFQLFAIKIHMAYLTNAEFYYADRSTLAIDQGKPASADRYVEISRAFARSIRALIHHYNHGMSGARWDGMFTPQDFPPPVMPLHPAATPALTIGEPGLGVVVWGDSGPVDAPQLQFSAAGDDKKWIEIFNSGSGSVAVEIETDPWIEIGPHPPVIAAETRVSVWISDPGDHAASVGRVRITAPDIAQRVDVAVHVVDVPTAPPGFAGVIEADGYVSIDPSRFDHAAPGRDAHWLAVPHLGRYGNPALQPEPLHGDPAGTGDAVVEYGMLLSTPGTHELELHRLPTLNSTGRIRVAVSIDDHAPIVVESTTTDEHRGGWTQAIQDNVERLRVTLPWLPAGPHRLRLHAIDDYVALSKVVIYTHEARRTNLGPRFSAHTARPVAEAVDPDPAPIDTGRIREEALAFYGVDPAALPLPDQIYADHRFWEGQTTFRAPHAVPQPRLGAPRLATGSARQDRIDVLGAGVVTETAGVLAFEAENVLAGGQDAWLSAADSDTTLSSWTHTSAETDGGTGLAMHVVPRGLTWSTPDAAPAMHFTIAVERAGKYRAWLLVKFDDNHDDSCALGVDGVIQPIEEQFSRGELCEYGLRQRWLWAHISNIELTLGDHVFSVHARKGGLRIDRVYLTLGDELPPIDAEWVPSPRTVRARASR